MMRLGTLPGRKPGMRTCEPIFLYAASRLGFSSSKGTSTSSRTRVGLKLSTVLFTCGSLLWLVTGLGELVGVFGGFAASDPLSLGRNAVRRSPRSVGVAGFEPTAPRSQSECATKLRHTPGADGGQVYGRSGASIAGQLGRGQGPRRTVTCQPHAGVAQWQSLCLPSRRCGFDSRRPLDRHGLSCGVATQRDGAPSVPVMWAEQ